MILRLLLILLLVLLCSSYQYGRKSQRYPPRPRCNPLNPQPVKPFSLNKLAGKQWFAIRVKPDQDLSVRQNMIELSDFRFEFFRKRRGEVKNDALISNRLGKNPGVCTISNAEFFSVRGREGFDWEFLCEIWGFPTLVKPYRFLYTDDNYAVTWECFKRNNQGSCTDYISLVLSTDVSGHIPPRTLSKIRAVIQEKVCLDLNMDYISLSFIGKKQCPRLKLF